MRRNCRGRPTGWLVLEAVSVRVDDKPFEHDEAHNLHRITLVREEDDEEVVFAMPDFVEQGDNLGEIARSAAPA